MTGTTAGFGAARAAGRRGRRQRTVDVFMIAIILGRRELVVV